MKISKNEYLDHSVKYSDFEEFHAKAVDWTIYYIKGLSPS